MRYYIGMCGKKYKIASFDGEREELVDLATLEKLKDCGDLIGSDLKNDFIFLSKYSSHKVPEDKMDSHYLKNTILRSELNLEYSLMHKFFVSFYFEAATKDLTYLTYRLAFERETDMSKVIEYLHEIKLVNFDYLRYRTLYKHTKCALIRIKVSANYANAAINALATEALKFNAMLSYAVTEKYSGLLLGIHARHNRCCWSTVKERRDTILISQKAQ